MGLWSSIKSTAKKVAKAVWRGAKAVGRFGVRGFFTLVAAGLNGLDLLAGFVGWPPKKLRLHVFVLRKEDGVPVMVDTADLAAAIENAQRIFKDHHDGLPVEALSAIPASRA